MTTKILVAVVAAVAIGFGGTYFATSSGGCSEGGCPVSRLLGLSDDSAAKIGGDCCSKNKECCDPPQACCGTASKAKASCCATGAACCEPGSACCEDKTLAKKKTDDVKTEPVSTPTK